MEDKYYKEFLDKTHSFLDEREFSNRQLDWIKSKIANENDVLFFSQIAQNIFESGFYN